MTRADLAIGDPVERNLFVGDSEWVDDVTVRDGWAIRLRSKSIDSLSNVTSLGLRELVEHLGSQTRGAMAPDGRPHHHPRGQQYEILDDEFTLNGEQ